MRRRRGFSLLEVLMAVALFGAVVTTILSAQAGLVAGNKSAANMSQAIEIGRCRMTEIEEKQLKLGYPEIEEKDSSQFCCDEKEVQGFTCQWQVERVLLPQVTSLAGDAGLSSVLGGGLGLDAGSIGSIASGMGTSLASPIGTMVSNPMGGAQLDLDGGLQNMGQMLGQQFGQQGGMGVQGLMTLVFSLVYPSLKPLLELAIRRVTVVVKWKEGKSDRDFTLMQYITNPSQAGLLAGLADAGMGAGEGGSTGTSTAPNTGGAPAPAPFGAPVSGAGR
jgi:general secretion pathway protein I